MTNLKTKVAIALAVGALMMTATPASAFYWSCVAKDSAGKEYEGRSFGLISPWIRQIATDRATKKCEEAGGRSCKLSDCVDLDVQPDARG